MLYGKLFVSLLLWLGLGTISSTLTAAYAPSEAEILAKLPGETVNDNLFISSTRFNWNGLLGNWTYELVSSNVGKITQTYDEDGNDPSYFREEMELTFTAPNSGTYVYREYYSNGLIFQNSDTFAFPWLESVEILWYSDASDLAAGWRYFDWFKGFKPEANNWIYHGRHGWLYVLGEDTNGLFLWDVALGRWMWTKASTYPWIYAYGGDEGWLYFFEGGRPGSRYFKLGDTGQIVPEQALGPQVFAQQKQDAGTTQSAEEASLPVAWHSQAALNLDQVQLSPGLQRSLDSTASLRTEEFTNPSSDLNLETIARLREIRQQRLAASQP